jgi:hypothetical protein
MAYKVGTTIVIDDSGTVDWSRIANKPVIGSGTITAVTITNGTPSAGVSVSGTASGYAGAYVGNCYVESLSGGGTSGAVSVTANRKSFNCNCNCRC